MFSDYLVWLSLPLAWWFYNVIYSLFWSPLSAIPSPLVFQILPFYYHIVRAKGISHLVLHYYYLHYGPVFRVGWENVVFVDHEAALKIFGTHQFVKGPIYDGFQYYGETLLSTRSRTFHTKRKKLMAPAFTKIKTYQMEPTVVEVGIKPFLEQVERCCSTGEIDLFRTFNHLTWDIMGGLAYGESFNMLQTKCNKAVDWMIALSRRAMLGHIFPPILKIPSYSGELLRNFLTPPMDKFYEKYALAKKEGRELPTTLIGLFIDSANMDGVGMSKKEVFSESHLMLFGGTDSTSNSLTWVQYLLMTCPDKMKKVVQEIDSLDIDGMIPYSICREKLPYLDACIKEAMRMMPGIPVAPTRVAPAGGCTVLGYYLPEGTYVSVPVYSLHNSPKLWDKPEKFIPERWINDIKKPLDETNYGSSQNFMPFLLGPRGCIGRNLAMMEILLTTANLLKKYQLSLADPNEPIATVALPSLRPAKNSLIAQVSRRT